MLTVKKFAEKLGLKILVEGDGLENKVEGCYCGDLLSWVMSRATAGDVWLTVMGNINSIAVAVLAEVSCIVLVENAPLDDDARQRAEMQGVTVLTTDKDAYAVASLLSAMGVK